MTILAGSRLGPYEILAPLGAGGMGEVWRARDAKLGRDVAVKVLPQQVASDPERLARFEREAKLLGSLNHPNIATIFGVEDSADTHALVMELVEGPTLQDQIAQGPIPIEEALPIALEIAEGLEFAHDRGVIHRDLKPANIKRTPQGRVKILDFGLAKALDPTGSSSPAVSRSPTITAQATATGVILGTAAYMSPEQARGSQADRRSDVWSFGCVLWEMLTGEKAFGGETVSDTLAAVLKEEPPWARLPQATPAGIRDLLRRCLTKDPRRRLQAIGDARIAMDEAIDGPFPTKETIHSKRPEASRRLWSIATAAAGAAALFGMGWLLRGGLAMSRPTAGAVVTSWTQLTDSPGVESEPTLSPDGKSLAYVSEATGKRGLFLLRVGGRNPLFLTEDSQADDWQPAFSPDGDRIAFRSERNGGGIFTMGSTGESVKRLTDFGFNPSWSPDGREVAVAQREFLFPTDLSTTQSDLVAVEVATGKRRKILTGSDALQPSWSPHGQRIAFWGVRGGSGQRDVWTVTADGSGVERATAVTDDPALDWGPAWSPDGRYLYFSSNRGGTMNLWRVRIVESTGQVLGKPEPVTTPSSWAGRISFSRDGRRFAYESLDWRSSLLKIAFDPKSGSTVGTPIPILRSTQPIRDHQLSPDGERVAFILAGSREDLALARTDGSQFLRLTDDPFRDRGPGWSPDGRRITFYSDRSGSYELWSVRPDGSGLEQVTRFGGNANFGIWSPDGAQIVESVFSSGPAALRWYLLDMRSQAFPMPARQMPPFPGEGDFWPFSWSPDGRRVAGTLILPNGAIGNIVFYSFQTGRYDVLNTTLDGFKTPVWLADSRRLIVRTPRGIWLLDSTTGEKRALISVGGYAVGLSVGISRDNHWITYTETATEGDIWLAELK